MTNNDNDKLKEMKNQFKLLGKNESNPLFIVKSKRAWNHRGMSSHGELPLKMSCVTPMAELHLAYHGGQVFDAHTLFAVFVYSISSYF